LEQHEGFKFETAEANGLAIGTVSLVSEHEYWVRWPETGCGCQCQLLMTSSIPVQLTVGDRVLVWVLGEASNEGVILGKIQGTRTGAESQDTNSDELVLQANQQITIRCGDGCITIRHDGKILIKGMDLVSKAARTNRIKGGSVEIN
jgi:hypothetical protein